MRPWHGVNPPPDWWGHWLDYSGYYYEKRTITTPNTQPVQAPVDEERVRKVVREEMADLLPIDVPDAPPEGLA